MNEIDTKEVDFQFGVKSFEREIADLFCVKYLLMSARLAVLIR